MKPNFRGFLLIAGSSLLAISTAHAAMLYWDGGTTDIAIDGDGASNGGGGTWNTTLHNWDPGTAPHVAWNNAGGDTAVFGGAAGLACSGPGHSSDRGRRAYISTNILVEGASPGASVTLTRPPGLPGHAKLFASVVATPD